MWRKDYMEAEVDQKAVLVHLHELHHFSSAWMRAITKRALAEAGAQLLGSENVEVHHNTLHAKAPEARAWSSAHTSRARIKQTEAASGPRLPAIHQS